MAVPHQIAAPLTREEKIHACVQHILESEGVPPFGEHAAELIARSEDLDQSFAELSRIILRDVGLTSQLLRVANSALYNRSSRPILNVAHAVMLLGWENVRNLVGAVRYIEQFAARSPGLRELMLMSVLTALHCRDVAVTVNYPHPEDAYLCGLFRNLGEVLIACHSPREYAEIVLKMHVDKMTERGACLAVLGFPWDEVAERVASSWNMPPSVLLQANDSPHAATSPMDRCLASIADYAHAITHAQYRKASGCESLHLATVIDPWGRGALVSPEDMARIVDSGLAEAQQLFATLQIPASRLRLDHQAELARVILYSTPVFDGKRLEELDRLLEEAATAVQGGAFELTAFIVGLLDVVRNAGFDRVVFGLVNEGHTLIRGRLASTQTSDEILSRFHFRIERGEGPVFAAMERRIDVLVDRTRDDRYDTSLLVTSLEPYAFALLPVVVQGKPAGCLYADRNSHTPGLDKIKPALGRARDVIAAAIARKTNRTTA